MKRTDFEKLIGLEKRRTAAVAMLGQMNGTWVKSIVLAGSYGEIDDKNICLVVDTMLRQHLESEIDTLTMSMEQLGVDGEAAA